ncbi:unnamed protein product [Closterium sp. NIES-64]|nr:unnamed protein product [Closterium sp. NIES-64]
MQDRFKQPFTSDPTSVRLRPNNVAPTATRSPRYAPPPVRPIPRSPHPPFAPSPLPPHPPFAPFSLRCSPPNAPLPPPLPPWCPPLALILSEASPTPKRTFSELSSAPSAALKAQVRELFKAAALKAQVRELFKAAALKAQVRELFKAAALKAQVRELFKAAALKAQSLTGGEPTPSITTAMAVMRPLKLLFGLKSIRRVVKTRVKAGSFPLDEDGVYFVIGDGSVAQCSAMLLSPLSSLSHQRDSQGAMCSAERAAAGTLTSPLTSPLNNLHILTAASLTSLLPLPTEGQLGRHVQRSSLPPMFIPSPLLTSHSFPPKQRDNEGAMCSTYCGWHDFRDNEGAMCSDYCGWHDFVRIRKKLIKVAYVGSPVKCPSSCWLAAFAFNDSPNSDKSFDSLLSTFAHELAEATSDPYVTNWYDAMGQENADICAWNEWGEVGWGKWGGGKWVGEVGWGKWGGGKWGGGGGVGEVGWGNWGGGSGVGGSGVGEVGWGRWGWGKWGGGSGVGEVGGGSGVGGSGVGEVGWGSGVGGVGWEDAVRFDSLLFTFAHELAEATCDSYVLNWYDAAGLGRRTPTYAPGSE